MTWVRVMKKATILIVEDEAIIAADLQDKLESSGYEVPFIEVTGEGAVKKALEIKPDLILMDIVLMGKMNGIDAAKQIHSQTDIPIIFLTAYINEELFQSALTTEPYAYLNKPTHGRDLERAIEVALNKHNKDKYL